MELNALRPEAAQLVREAEIRAVPTLQFIGKDGKVKNTLVGVQSKEKLEEELKKLLE